MTLPTVPDQADPTHHLSRSLKGRHLAMISIGGIIGAGLFVGSSTSIKAAGPAVFISYALTGMLMSGMLRRPLTDSLYGNPRYVATCVALFLKGIER